MSGSLTSRQDTPTPSIHVTPSPSRTDSSQPRACRTDSIVNGITALNIECLQSGSPGASGQRESRSPTPSRRRRSGNGTNRDIHQIENEKPPETLFHMPEVQGSLANARLLTARMINVLSSSNLHRENGSSIQSLHRQATRLNSFQLPSSRIVGLVGDSGVGKSSLINSLLDKEELARAVSELHAVYQYLPANLKVNRAAAALHAHVPLRNISSTIEKILSFMSTTSHWMTLRSNSRNCSELIGTTNCSPESQGVETETMVTRVTEEDYKGRQISPEKHSERALGLNSNKCRRSFLPCPLSMLWEQWSSGHHSSFHAKKGKNRSTHSKLALRG